MNAPSSEPVGPQAGAARDHDPYCSLRIRNFRLYLAGNVIANLGGQMQIAAVQWEVYQRTDSAQALALVGLVQFFPVLAFVLPAGHVADHFDRRRVVMLMQLVWAIGSIGLAAVSFLGAPVIWIYLFLLMGGTARAFSQPAKQALLPQLVPAAVFSNAVTWGSGGFHLADVVGPAIAGLLIWWLGGASWIYIIDTGLVLTFFVMLALIRHRAVVAANKNVTLRSLAAGIGYLRRSPVVFGSITLDMFAVLLGGATTLLPIYAKDILRVEAYGYGLLRAAPAAGSVLMTLVLAFRPPMERAGRALLMSVAGFGLTTIAFGLSQSFWLSLSLLVLLGALDQVSVVIRHTLVQLLTPDEMRGRVSAINTMFIGASNELGGFESGIVAHYFTPVISVVSGGIGTLVVVGLVAWAWPQVRRFGRLTTTVE